MNIKTRIETSKLSKTQRQVIDHLLQSIEDNKRLGSYVSPRGVHIDEMPTGTQQRTVNSLVKMGLVTSFDDCGETIYDIKDGLYVTGEITL